MGVVGVATPDETAVGLGRPPLGLALLVPDAGVVEGTVAARDGPIAETTVPTRDGPPQDGGVGLDEEEEVLGLGRAARGPDAPARGADTPAPPRPPILPGLEGEMAGVDGRVVVGRAALGDGPTLVAGLADALVIPRRNVVRLSRPETPARRAAVEDREGVP